MQESKILKDKIIKKDILITNLNKELYYLLSKFDALQNEKCSLEFLSASEIKN